MKYSCIFSLALAFALIPFPLSAKVNSGSDGSDGALNPTSNLVIDMAANPDGIYHYTSVNIPAGVTVSFTRNAGNTPVVWLVQGECLISGTVTLAGKSATGSEGGSGGVGGYRGGNGGTGKTMGSGPGGGMNGGGIGWSASFATAGFSAGSPAAEIYGNQFLVPLVGGSGGGGGGSFGGGGGGGALMIACDQMRIDGIIDARGGEGIKGSNWNDAGGAGSGGAIRIVANQLRGTGGVMAKGGPFHVVTGWGSGWSGQGGDGRVRFDLMENLFSGYTDVSLSQGFQPIILPPSNTSVSLSIQSIGGVSVAASPGGLPTSPDVVVPASQQNPVSIVVKCTNIPLGSEIIVDVKPANGPTIRAVALNNAGSKASSTATVQVEMPRGGGTIQAKAISGIQLAANDDPNAEHNFIAQAGWTADGERFKAVEVTAGLGASCQLVYLTESGKRYTLNSH